MTLLTIGIDVSKDTLDAWRDDTGEYRQFPNRPAGLRGLLAWIGRKADRCVQAVYEPTGAYHRDLELALVGANVATIKVNPLQARRFAEACGQLSKTDRLDAQMLARMAVAIKLEATEVRTEIMHQLKELRLARNTMVRDRVAVRNRLAQVRNLFLRKIAALDLKRLDQRIISVEREIARVMASDPVLETRRKILISIPGIGPTAAAMLLIEMPELGTLENRQAASLAGVAARPRQSGKREGQARIRGGRSEVRIGLYMPALAAIRSNPDIRAQYQRLVEAGKPAKIAIVAAMRKLIILANAKLKSMQAWTPNPA